MFNWKRIAVTGLVVGMVAATGCSSNLPETNQGNRNGQRVADSVNRRTDSYRTTGHRLSYTENGGTYRNTDGFFGRTTRGLRRAANDVVHPNRVNDGYNRTTRGITNNPLNLGRPQGRIGNTYRYGHNRGYIHGLNDTMDYNCNTGDYCYDTGVTTTEQSLVNNRTTRSTATSPAAVPNNNVNRAVSNRSTAATPKTETKRVDTKRSSTPAKTTESTATNEVNTIVPQGTSMLAPSNTTPNRAVNHNHRDNYRAGNRVTRKHTQARHISPSTSNVDNNNETVTRGTHSTSRYGMSLNNTVRNSQDVNYMNNNRHLGNSRIAPSMDMNNNIYGYDQNVNYANNSRGLNNATIGMATNMEQTVPVINSDDSFATSNDTAFFRKKAGEQTTPAMPEPVTPPVIPAPATGFNDIDDNYEQTGYDDSNYDNNYEDTTDNDTSQPTTQPTAPARVPTRAVARRAMK